MDYQEWIIAIVVAACVTYAARRVWKNFRKRGDGHGAFCADCPLAGSCNHSSCQCNSGSGCCH